MFKVVLKCAGKDFNGRLTTNFDPPLKLKGQWEVSVQHLSCGERDFKTLVLSDLADYTMVGDARMKFLDLIDTDDKNRIAAATGTYVSVLPKQISSINIDLVRYDNQRYSWSKQKEGRDIICVLHFRKS